MNNISTTHGNICPTNHCNIISANHCNSISTKLTLTAHCHAFIKRIWSKLFKFESESDNFREHCSNHPLVLSRISWTHKIFPNDFPIKRNMYANTEFFVAFVRDLLSSIFLKGITLLLLCRKHIHRHSLSDFQKWIELSNVNYLQEDTIAFIIWTGKTQKVQKLQKYKK